MKCDISIGERCCRGLEAAGKDTLLREILVARPYPRGAMLWCTGAMQRRGYRRVAGAMIQRLACLSSPWPSAVTCLF
jgi:hypothetical protein